VKREKSHSGSNILSLTPIRRPSLFSSNKSKDDHHRMKRKDLTEVISQKKQGLTSYLYDLFQLPEIIGSEELQLFLDEESIDGYTIEDKTVSEIDFLLEGESSITKTVLRRLDIPIHADAGQVCDILFMYIV
jgi:hypothetical protein